MRPAGIVTAFLVAVLLGPACAAARADDANDLACTNASGANRTFADVTHHLPQPLGTLLGAAHDVSAQYQICATQYRALFRFENMNYALVTKAHADLFAATLEAKYGRPEAARRDAQAALDAAQVVASYKDRAADPGPDQNASGGQVTLDLRHDSVPSLYDREAKDQMAQARTILATLGATPEPSTAPLARPQAQPAPAPSPAST